MKCNGAHQQLMQCKEKQNLFFMFYTHLNGPALEDMLAGCAVGTSALGTSVKWEGL